MKEYEPKPKPKLIDIRSIGDKFFEERKKIRIEEYASLILNISDLDVAKQKIEAILELYDEEMDGNFSNFNYPNYSAHQSDIDNLNLMRKNLGLDEVEVPKELVH